ncbi:hypothetical protein F5884DRAFT_878533 [Xylogone sp. PMI_703]|nr:hypothetical protein F5884DRAFT_878533 [Xylogone sp. PMI_703]
MGVIHKTTWAHAPRNESILQNSNATLGASNTGNGTEIVAHYNSTTEKHQYPANNLATSTTRKIHLQVEHLPADKVIPSHSNPQPGYNSNIPRNLAGEQRQHGGVVTPRSSEISDIPKDATTVFSSIQNMGIDTQTSDKTELEHISAGDFKSNHEFQGGNQQGKPDIDGIISTILGPEPLIRRQEWSPEFQEVDMLGFENHDKGKTHDMPSSIDHPTATIAKRGVADTIGNIIALGLLAIFVLAILWAFVDGCIRCLKKKRKERLQRKSQSQTSTRLSYNLAPLQTIVTTSATSTTDPIHFMHTSSPSSSSRLPPWSSLNNSASTPTNTSTEIPKPVTPPPLYSSRLGTVPNPL